MSLALHRDPTLEAAQVLEIHARRCETCTGSRLLSDARSVCTRGKTFPLCRNDKRSGFELRLV